MDKVIVRDVPKPDYELGSGRILHYPVRSGLQGFITKSTAPPAGFQAVLKVKQISINYHKVIE